MSSPEGFAGTIETFTPGFRPEASLIAISERAWVDGSEIHLPTHIRDGVGNTTITDVLHRWGGDITDIQGLKGLFTCMTPFTTEDGFVVDSANASSTLWDQMEPALRTFSQLPRDKQEAVAGAVGMVLWTLVNAPEERIVHGELRDISPHVREVAEKAYKQLEISVESLPQEQALPVGKIALKVGAALVIAEILAGCVPGLAATPPKEAQTAYAATHAVPTLQAPLPSPTQVEPSPTPTARPTKTRVPTATKTEMPKPTKTELPPPTEKVPWTDKIFFTEDEIPTGAINLDKIPPPKWKDVKITGPGQAFYNCNLPGKIKQYEQQKKVFSGIQLDLNRSDLKFCVPCYVTEQGLKDYISQDFSTLSPAEQQELLARDILLSQAFTDAVPKGKTVFLDAYYYFYLQWSGKTIQWVVWSNPYPETGEPSVVEVLDIPLPTPRPTPNP